MFTLRRHRIAALFMQYYLFLCSFFSLLRWESVRFHTCAMGNAIAIAKRLSSFTIVCVHKIVCFFFCSFRVASTVDSLSLFSVRLYTIFVFVLFVPYFIQFFLLFFSLLFIVLYFHLLNTERNCSLFFIFVIPYCVAFSWTRGWDDDRVA